MSDDKNHSDAFVYYRVIWGQREGFATQREAVNFADSTGALLVLDSQDRVLWKDALRYEVPCWRPIEVTMDRGAYQAYAVVWLLKDVYSDTREDAIARAEDDDALLVLGPDDKVVWTNPDGCWIVPSSKTLAWDIEVIGLPDAPVPAHLA